MEITIYQCKCGKLFNTKQEVSTCRFKDVIKSLHKIITHFNNELLRKMGKVSKERTKIDGQLITDENYYVLFDIWNSLDKQYNRFG